MLRVLAVAFAISIPVTLVAQNRKIIKVLVRTSFHDEPEGGTGSSRIPRGSAWSRMSASVGNG